LSLDKVGFDGSASLPVETECENFDRKIDIDYLCQNLKSCEGEYILFEFTKTDRPVHMFSPQNNKFKVITMPMPMK